MSSFEDYGKLSRRDPDEMLAGARVDVAPYKRDPGDFVLWKPSSDELPGWESPWGRGRPGWHIECSAMAAAHLGPTIDIHAGGVDLQFPHHENEIAQSECAHGGATFARFWLHNGMLNFSGAKMSKSLGNIETVHDLIAKHPPEALRYALLSAHYRQPLDWSDGLIEQATNTLDRLYGTLRDLAALEACGSSGVEVSKTIPVEVESALQDDLNTPLALSVIASIASEARALRNELVHGGEPSARMSELHAVRAKLLGAGLALGAASTGPGRMVLARHRRRRRCAHHCAGPRAQRREEGQGFRPGRRHPQAARRRRYRAGRHTAGRALETRLTVPSSTGRGARAGPDEGAS